MLDEIYPDGSPVPLQKPPTSDKQAAANRRNALLSTGPKTDEGKRKSRANALKHGFCAMVVDVPGEDPAVFEGRLKEWDSELNPHGSSVDHYMITLMTRHSINLDRCFSVQNARVAQLARDAIKDHDEVVARDVEDLLVHLTQEQQYLEVKSRIGLKADYLKIGPPPQPGHAVRRLMATSRGCQALFAEWELLRTAMAEPPTWDRQDAIRASNLMGASCAARGETCNPLGVATLDITLHRDVAFKLKNNLIPNSAPWGQCYTSEASHQTDRNQIEELTYNAASGNALINALIDDQQRIVCTQQGVRETEEELTRSEAPARARFDASDEGKLLYRYQAEQHRGFIKLAELLKKQAREAEKAVKAQPVTSKQVESVAVSAPAISTPPEPRNEAIEKASANPSKGSNVVKSERKDTLPRSENNRHARRHPE
jgi:hypothetical protein